MTYSGILKPVPIRDYEYVKDMNDNIKIKISFWVMKEDSSAKNGHHRGMKAKIAKDNTHRANRRNYKASRLLNKYCYGS